MSVQVKSLVIIKDRDLMESICYIKTNTITIIYHIYIAPFASVNQIKASLDSLRCAAVTFSGAILLVL